MRSAIISASKDTSEATAARPTSVDQNRSVTMRDGDVMMESNGDSTLPGPASTSAKGWPVPDEGAILGIQAESQREKEVGRFSEQRERQESTRKNVAEAEGLCSQNDCEDNTLLAYEHQKSPELDNRASPTPQEPGSGVGTMTTGHIMLVSELVRLRNVINLRLQYEIGSKGETSDITASGVADQTSSLSH